MYVIFLPACCALICVFWIFLAMSEGEKIFWMLLRVERESLKIVMLLSSTFDMEYSIALRIARASAVYIEQFLESFH